MADHLFRPDGTVRRRWRQAGLPGWLDELAERVDQHELDADSVYLAWELSNLTDGWVDADREAFVRIVLASLIAIRQGSTRLRLDPTSLDWFGANFTDIVAKDALVPFIDRALTVLKSDQLNAVVGRPGDYKPLILDGDWLYHQRTLAYEEQLAERIESRAALSHTISQDELTGAFDPVLAHPPTVGGVAMALSDEQAQAIRVALQSPLTIITGGPGTGKTSIVVSLLRVLSRLGVEPDTIALAAPTGKAANRMSESIGAQLATVDEPHALAGIQPQTLHRLLDFSRRRQTFRHGRDNPLKHNVVIVDEASMIDLVMMERLVSAIRDDARLILLGDAEQLPSVETGTILRDLIPADETTLPGRAVVRLHHSFRMDASNPQGRAILSCAEAIRVGDADASVSAMTAVDVVNISFEGASFVPTDATDDTLARHTLRDFLDRWYTQRVLSLSDLNQLATLSTYRMRDGEFSEDDIRRLDRLFEHFNHCRILCLTRVFAAGANAINELFHKRMVRRTPDVTDTNGFVPGEPVMMLKNDYDRNLFNGDQGLILRVDTDGEPRFMAVFATSGTYKAFHLNALRGQLDLSFAMTVHKSQGSEFDHVALVLPEADMPLLTREILYTGVTRAKRSVTVVGREPLLRAGVERRILRFSGVSERLGT